MKITKRFQHEDIQGFKFGSWPFGKPSMYSHIYFIDGLLIDTGHSNMRKEVMEQISPIAVEQIFITHHHEDHTGNLAALQAHFDCPSYASALCTKMMKSPPKISPAQMMTWGKRKANFDLQTIENQIKTPTYTFDLIPVPGHAPDMLALHEANQGWLFSADLWVSTYIKYFMRSESMKGQIESIKKILELDFEVMLCSHNPQFKDGKKLLAKKLHFLEDFYEKVASLHQKGHSSQHIFKEMHLKENWSIRLMSLGALSTMNMVKAVIRDEKRKRVNTDLE